MTPRLSSGREAMLKCFCVVFRLDGWISHWALGYVCMSSAIRWCLLRDTAALVQPNAT